MDRIYNAGIYCRLSKDDDRPGESMSIETQRAMLTEYCEKNGYNIYGEEHRGRFSVLTSR